MRPFMAAWRPVEGKGRGCLYPGERRTAGGAFESRDVLRKKSRKSQLERRRIAKMRDTKTLKTSWQRAIGATED